MLNRPAREHHYSPYSLSEPRLVFEGKVGGGREHASSRHRPVTQLQRVGQGSTHNVRQASTHNVGQASTHHAAPANSIRLPHICPGGELRGKDRIAHYNERPVARCSHRPIGDEGDCIQWTTREEPTRRAIQLPYKERRNGSRDHATSNEPKSEGVDGGGLQSQ